MNKYKSNKTTQKQRKVISLKARIVTTFTGRGHGTHTRVPGVAGIILLPELGGNNKSYNKFIKLHKYVVWFSVSIFYFTLKWLIHKKISKVQHKIMT